MPLKLLDYATLGDKSTLPIWNNRYNTFGAQVISLLEQRASEQSLESYQLMSNIRVIQRLLGHEYIVRAIEKPREFPQKKLRATVQSKRLACIIEGSVRYIIIHEKKLH